MKLLLILFISLNLFSQDNIVLKQQNVLQVQKIVESEEKIAFNFEKYLLENYKIPTMNDLIDNKYLGSNFSKENRFGDEIDFKSASDLKLKYAISKYEIDFKNLLYKRDLYRDYTSVYEVTTVTNGKQMINESTSYVLIKLQSDEAKNIFEILKSNTIESTCSDTLVSTYCNVNDTTIRWYNSSSNWIEYSKRDFENGNVTLKSNALLNDSKLTNLPIGTYIFVHNGSKYIKLMDKSDGSLNILKVD